MGFKLTNGRCMPAHESLAALNALPLSRISTVKVVSEMGLP
jgi:hypothetical protein